MKNNERRLLGLAERPEPMPLGLAERLEPMLLGVASSAKSKEDYWVLLCSRTQSFLVKSITELLGPATNLTQWC